MSGRQDRPDPAHRLAAEAVGTAFLLATVVGSGIMGERLADGNVAVALLANTLATGAALVALILTFGPISGAHFNPAVTLADASQGGLPWRDVPGYVAVPLIGAGTATAFFRWLVPSLPHVLFLCTHNSARSQMAEGFLRAQAGDRVEVESAGTEETRVNPLAIRAMSEVGIDLGGHRSKTLDRFLDAPWDYVITVCDSANERCPIFPRSAQRLHWSFEDPSRATGSEEERLQVFRRIRDEIAARIRAWLAERTI